MVYVDLSNPSALILENKKAYNEVLTRIWFNWLAYDLVAYKVKRGYVAYVRISPNEFKRHCYTPERFKDQLFITAL